MGVRGSSVLGGPRGGAGQGVLAAALLLWQPKLKLCVWAPLVFLGELEEGCCEMPWR